MGNIKRISSSEANAITPSELQSMAGIRFGGIFMLRGVKTVTDQSGLHIDFAWESLVEQKLSYTNEIHLTDALGNILAQADYSQPLNRFSVEKGTIWKDSISIPSASLDRGECRLAIALYPQNRPDRILAIDRGDRDWGDRRVSFDLGKTEAGIQAK